MDKEFDFSGWATRANLKCSDGRTIMKDAFKHNDGETVPLVWNHKHDDPLNVLGHALLKNQEEGVYAYCKFNSTEAAKHAKELVEHGDISALSIYANQLKQNGGNVSHGVIREVSLVLAGANPGASIDSIMCHGAEIYEEGIIYTGEPLSLYHADSDKKEEKKSEEADKKEEKKSEDKTIEEIVATMTEEQQEAMCAVVGLALASEVEDDDDEKDVKHSEGGDEDMKHNVFDKKEEQSAGVLIHSAMTDIIKTAKLNSVGSLQDAISMYAEQDETLAHGIDEIETLFPEYKDVYPGAPELIERDQSWVSHVMSKVHKSPISRIRTRQADARGTDLRAFGYKQKGDKKEVAGNIKLLKRTTDPQTVYRKDALHRDDIIDITDFDVVEYQYRVMRHNLDEELATAFLIGDGRDDGDDYKISEEHIRSIWNDDELYTIHADVDIAAAKAELQGTGTSVSFGDNYVYAEAIIQSALYSREQYRGSGSLEFYCTPHLLNVMLLARDMNGRRIYSSKADLQAALNVTAIHTVEQFEGKVRTTKENEQKKLLGIFVNLRDYQVGATKGGEITRFNQFDIDFNQEKYLIETRVSGALTRIKSAIVLEEPVSAAG